MLFVLLDYLMIRNSKLNDEKKKEGDGRVVWTKSKIIIITRQKLYLSFSEE